MRILQVTAPAAVGGLESVVRGLVRGQTAAGHEVHLAAVVHGEPDLDPFLSGFPRDRGVQLHPLSVPRRGYLQERRLLDTLCREIRPDVLHSHGFRPDVVDAGVGRRLGIPLVTTVHGHNHDGFREKISEWLQHRAFRTFDAVIAVSRPLVRRLRDSGVPTECIHLVPNAWTGCTSPLGRDEARRALGIPGSTLHVGWVGRLEPEKGPDLFLSALAQLGDLPLVASIVGDGRMGEGLRREAAAGGLSSRIRWHGVVPDAGRYFAAFDVFVLSSRTEGTPMVLFEAMEAEVPLVCTRVGGVPDVVGKGEAILVPPSPEALARSIRTVVEDPGSARARARAARRLLFDEFDRATWIARHEAIYRQVSTPDRRRHRWTPSASSC